MPRAPRVKQERSAKQKISDTKNILSYEKKDDFINITTGFVLGSVTVLIAAFIAAGL